MNNRCIDELLVFCYYILVKCELEFIHHFEWDIFGRANRRSRAEDLLESVFEVPCVLYSNLVALNIDIPDLLDSKAWAQSSGLKSCTKNSGLVGINIAPQFRNSYKRLKPLLNEGSSNSAAMTP